jgi:hypothetical protein
VRHSTRFLVQLQARIEELRKTQIATIEAPIERPKPARRRRAKRQRVVIDMSDKNAAWGLTDEPCDT